VLTSNSWASPRRYSVFPGLRKNFINRRRRILPERREDGKTEDGRRKTEERTVEKIEELRR